jgi:hypothetical protein
MSYAIMTKDGWKPLLPPMAPAPAAKKWWSFAGERKDDSPADAAATNDKSAARTNRSARR